jgi:hypothetical protein
LKTVDSRCTCKAVSSYNLICSRLGAPLRWK